MRRGESPTHFIDMIPYAIRLSNPLTIMPLAIKNPPKNKKIIGFANDANDVFISATPHSTHKAGPNNDVTGIGTGSLIHQIATNDMIANNLCCAASNPAIGKNHTNSAQIGPTIAPIICRFLSNEELLSIIVMNFYLYCLFSSLPSRTRSARSMTFARAVYSPARNCASTNVNSRLYSFSVNFLFA